MPDILLEWVMGLTALNVLQMIMMMMMMVMGMGRKMMTLADVKARANLNLISGITTQ